jgi:hypothetical protein
MAKIDINGILKSIEDQAKALAQQKIKDYSQQALADVKSTLQDSKDDLQRWVEELVRGDIDKDEFESLVQGQIDVAKMQALKQAGLAQVQIESFVNGVIDIIVNAAFSAIP